MYPFVVVCFDGDVNNEVHKSEAAVGGETCTWNSAFDLDLTVQIKNLVAAGHAEPTYLTFFLFDTGQTGIPSLGSAGVLLSTVQEHGIAQGDFPVVNGTGTINITVSSTKYKSDEEQSWYQTNTAKIAAGTGVAALAAGVAGLTFNQIRKKKKKKTEEEDQQPLQGGTRSLPAPEEEEDSDREEEDEEEDAPQQQQAAQGSNRNDGSGSDSDEEGEAGDEEEDDE